MFSVGVLIYAFIIHPNQALNQDNSNNQGADATTSRRKHEPVVSDESRLMEALFHDYNPTARPVVNSSQTVPVRIQFSLMHIKSLDVRSQVITTTGLIILQWNDERLRWRPSDYNNLKDIVIEPPKLWRPEFAVLIGAERIQDDFMQFRAMIKHDGSVRWEPGGVFKTMCEIDITYYPFDEQTCEIIFGAWTYQTNKVNLTNTSPRINMDSYKSNGEWEIYTTRVTRDEFFYTCCPDERFSNVAFAVHLRRRHTYYIINIILPTIMTSILLLAIFFCTPGQKVQIGVVVLLSFRIFLLNVADNIPKTSDHIPILGVYLTCTMAITTLSMVLTVFVLNLHHKEDTPVPAWLKTFTLKYLARIALMCDITKTPKASSKTVNSSTKQIHRNGHLLEDERQGFIEMGMCPRNRLATGRGEHVICKINGTHAQSNLVTPEVTTVRSYARDWQNVAKVFDRLFFWLFLLAIITSTVALFHPIISRPQSD